MQLIKVKATLLFCFPQFFASTLDCILLALFYKDICQVSNCVNIQCNSAVVTSHSLCPIIIMRHLMPRWSRQVGDPEED